jgi:hypothetical protein
LQSYFRWEEKTPFIPSPNRVYLNEVEVANIRPKWQEYLAGKTSSITLMTFKQISNIFYPQGEACTHVFTGF